MRSRKRTSAGIRSVSAGRPAASLFEHLLAANRRLMIGPASRLYWLKATVIVAFCIGLAMSAPLWTGDRTFPAAPAVAALPPIDGIVADVLFAALFLLGAAIVVAPRPRWFIAAFLTIIAVFCLTDQTRWQPWVFLYVFLLATLALFSWDGADADGRRSALNVARLIIACTYVFSGLQKTNHNFVDVDFAWIVSPITGVLPSTAHPLHVLAVMAPFLQIAFGLGLMTFRFRRVSLIAAVAMHGFILAMFGPLGLDWNRIIWPWTAAMAAFDVILFADSERYGAGEILSPRGRPYHAFVLIVFAALPVLSFFNLWDSYLSAALYSGNLTEGTIYLSDAGIASVPPSVAHYAVRSSDNTNVLNIQRWAIEDLNVTPYPEMRVYRAVARQVCGQLGDRRQLVLIVREQRMFRSRPETGYRCSDL